MKNLGKYDRITQSVEIPDSVIYQARIQGSAERLRKYIHTELVHKLSEKLLESGYITETWLKREDSEECIATLYVKPLIKKRLIIKKNPNNYERNQSQRRNQSHQGWRLRRQRRRNGAFNRKSN